VKIRRLIIVLAVLSLSMFGQQENTAKQAPAAEEVKKAELELARLQVKADWKQYAAHLTDDFVRTTNTGQFQNKEETLADLRSGTSVILDAIPEELQVRIHGDSAILTGHLTALTRQNGRVTTLFSRFTAIFVKQDGQWLLAAWQATRVLK